MDSVGKFRNSKVKRKSEYFELKDKSQSGKGDFIYG